MINKMGDSIIISSAKGGVGKTNFVVNLGIAFAKHGKEVIIIDGSLTTSDLSLYCDVPFYVSSVPQLLRGSTQVEAATFNHKAGIKIIPGSLHVSSLDEFEGDRFSKLLKQLKKQNDIVLVDCAAGLGREALSAIKSCDYMLAVANPELASVVNASKLIQVSKGLKTKPLGVVLNRVGKIRKELNENEIEPLLYGVPIIGKIREDKKVPISIRESEAVVHYYPKSRVSRDFRNIAASLLGMEPEKGFFEKWFS
jgi:septum site-determining protein MinD